jgi:hypothetical protein
MNTNKKQQFDELVQSNIDQYGYHVYIVGGSLQPRFAYTIGLTGLFNFELVFPGGAYYLKEDLLQIFDEIVKELKRSDDTDTIRIMVDSLGLFSLLPVNSSWSKLMLLGVFDYYKKSDIRAYQVIPDLNHYTLDIPDMSKDWNPSSEPVWQWLTRKWDYNVPEHSTVATNINALLGETITEVMRCGNDEWEMFAGPGPEVEKKDMRVASLGTVLGIDKGLVAAIDLEIGKGLWREDADSDWNNWG